MYEIALFMTPEGHALPGRCDVSFQCDAYVPLICARKLCANLFCGVAPHQCHGAAAEARTGHAHAEHTGHGNRRIMQEIQFAAGDVVIMPQADVGSVHEFAENGKVSLLQTVHTLQHALILRDHVPAFCRDVCGQIIFEAVELFHGNVTKRRDPGQVALKQLEAPLTGVSPVVVRGTGQGARHARVEDQQPVVLKRHGHMLVFQAAAVQKQGRIGSRKTRGELIHDAALNAHVFILRLLARARQFRQRHLNTTAVQEEKTHGHLERGRRTQARTQGHIAPDHGLHTGRACCAFRENARHRLHVQSPALGGFSPIHAQLGLFIEIHGIELHLRTRSRAACDVDRLLQPHGHDVAVIVIRVFSDEIHPAGSAHGEHVPGIPEHTFKLLFHFLSHRLHDRAPVVRYGNRAVTRP